MAYFVSSPFLVHKRYLVIFSTSLVLVYHFFLGDVVPEERLSPADGRPRCLLERWTFPRPRTSPIYTGEEFESMKTTPAPLLSLSLSFLLFLSRRIGIGLFNTFSVESITQMDPTFFSSSQSSPLPPLPVCRPFSLLFTGPSKIFGCYRLCILSSFLGTFNLDLYRKREREREREPFFSFSLCSTSLFWILNLKMHKSKREKRKVGGVKVYSYRSIDRCIQQSLIC